MALVFDPETRPTLKVRVSFDGGCRNNPNGIAAGGAVITDLDGNVLRHVGRFIDQGSNNVAEWTGLRIGLQAALDLGATHVEAIGDSELIVKQFNGEYSVHNASLRVLSLEVHRLRSRFVEVTMQWRRREENKAADSICSAVLDGRYVSDAPTLEAAVGKRPSKGDAAAAVGGEIAVTFTCRAMMDPAVVRAARERGATDEKLRDQLAQEAERRLIMAGQLGQLAISPKRVRAS